MENTRGSEWNRWDLHLHTASSYDANIKGMMRISCFVLH